MTSRRSRPAKPPRGLGWVLIDADASKVKIAQLHLGSGVSLIGSLPVPIRRLCKVPRDILPGVIVPGQLKLLLQMALLGLDLKIGTWGRRRSDIKKRRF